MGSRSSPDALLAMFFGGARARRDAFDMNHRIASAYPVVVLVLVLSVIPGLVHYNWLAGPVWQMAGFSFYGSLALPKHTKRPELTAITFWLMGLMWTLLAGWAAGSPLAYLAAASAISLPFLAVIWPLRVLVAAVLILVPTSAVMAALVSPDEVANEPVSLALPMIAMVLCALSASVVADVDRRNRRAVTTDPLTGLGNRAALWARVADLVAEAEVLGSPVSLAVVDLDHFKALNDRLGHAQGDAALRRTAIALAGELGASGRLYRYGGEEFVALLPRASAKDAAEIAERLRVAVSRVTVGGQPLALSGGCATATAAPEFDLDRLFRRADQALYAAKAEGRNRIVSAVPEGPLLADRRPVALVPKTVDGRSAGPASRTAQTRGVPFRLVRTRVERDHLRAVFLALHRPYFVRASNLTVIALVAAAVDTVGWRPLVFAIIAAVVLDPRARASTRSLKSSRGGELAPLFESILAMVLIGVGIAVADTNALYALPLILTPAFSAIAGYRGLGSLIVSVTGGIIIVATGLAVSPEAIAANPLVISLPIGLLGCITLTGAAIAKSAMEHGAAAVIDPLTGALNRSALDARLPELARECDDGPGALIVADLDHFKAVNDSFGHGVGDLVLGGVAGRLQSELRLVDALYRVGGEEFVAVLPGVDETEAAVIAERLRVAIASSPVVDIPLTISLGVAASRGQEFDYAVVFDRADAALFEAKRSGRDRVAIADDPRLVMVA